MILQEIEGGISSPGAHSGVEARLRQPASDVCVLMIDGQGTIRGPVSGDGSLFGIDLQRLIGRPVADWIHGLLLQGDCHSYNLRYLAYLAHFSGWRHFEAIDIDAQRFAVELRVRMPESMSPGLFIMEIRRVTELR
jgi:hypothetical protein